MARESLGLIETRGLAAALEASDAASKAANVIVSEIEIPSAGVCTVKIMGEVADVLAAVDAGSAAAGRVGEVIAKHTIARPAQGTEKLIKSGKVTLSETSGSISHLPQRKHDHEQTSKTKSKKSNKQNA